MCRTKDASDLTVTSRTHRAHGILRMTRQTGSTTTAIFFNELVRVASWMGKSPDTPDFHMSRKSRAVSYLAMRHIWHDTIQVGHVGEYRRV